jgi:uncharacterized damage-inducible protein DinB
MAPMDSTDRNSFTERLRETRDAFVASVQGVSEEQGRFKAGPEGWSIQDCVEHLALAEPGLLRQICENSTAADSPVSRERETAILNSGGGNRQEKFKAPEKVQPTGRFGSLAEALRQFTAVRERTIAFVAGCDDDLRMRSTVHPLRGPMRCSELLAFIVVHPLRHAAQIREIKASAGYPVN